MTNRVSDLGVISRWVFCLHWQVAIWGRRDASGQMAYARDIAPKSLAFFEEYFDIKFPLPKQDMVAIPDFSAGAMENWGLITYRWVLVACWGPRAAQTA